MAWRVADAHELPYADAAFDVVLSALGVMFAADPALAAEELCRVARPGGRVVLAAWMPEGFSRTLHEAIAEVVESDPGEDPPPHRWGRPENLRAWLGPWTADLTTASHQVHWRFADLDEATTWMAEHGAPLAAARAAHPDREEALRTAARVALAAPAKPTAKGIVVPVRYLLAAARRFT